MSVNFSPDKFLKYIANNGDLAKPSKFMVEFISGPPDWATEDLRNFTYVCEAAELPGYNINSLESKVGRLSWYVPSTANMNDLILTILMPSDMIEKSHLDDLMRIFTYSDGVLSQSPSTSLDGVPFANYLYDIGLKLRISQLPESGEAYFERTFNLPVYNPTPENDSPLSVNHYTKVKFPTNYWDRRYVVEIEEAFPISMQPLPLSWGDTDGIHKLQMTFKYYNWRVIAPDGVVQSEEISYSNQDGVV